MQFKAKGRPEFQNERARCQRNHGHDSGAEIKECFDLTLREKAGDIRGFDFHKVLELLGPSGHVIGFYEIDFVVYGLDGTTEFVEVKGGHLEKEGLWRLKWKLLIDKHKGDQMYKFRVVKA